MTSTLTLITDERGREEAHACRVTSGPIETDHKAKLDRVVAGVEHDRDGHPSALQHAYRAASKGEAFGHDHHNVV
jgi:hypothetical protein